MHDDHDHDHDASKGTSNPWPDRINEAYYDGFGAEFGRVSRDRINWMCGQAKGQKVLDVGCSQGITSILLAREGMHVTGIDIFKPVIDYALGEREKEVESVAKRVDFRCSELAALDAGQFDTIIMGEVIEHQTNPGRFVSQAARLVAPDGRIVITVPFGLHPWPDHKSTVFPSDIYRPIQDAFHLTSLEVTQGYIRMVADRRAEGEKGGEEVQAVLLATERGALQWQERYYETNGKLQGATKAKADGDKQFEKLQQERKILVDRQSEGEKALSLKEIQLESFKSRLSDAVEQAERFRQTLLAQLEAAKEANLQREHDLHGLKNDLAIAGEKEREHVRLHRSLEEHARKLEQDIANLRESEQSLRREIEQRNQACEALEAKVASLEQKSRDLEADIQRAQERFEERIADAQQTHQKLLSDHDRTQSRLASLQDELDVAQQKRDGHYRHLEAERARTKKLVPMLEELHAENQRFRQSSALQIGRAVLGLRSFRGFVGFPKAILRAWASYRLRGGEDIEIEPFVLPRLEPVPVPSRERNSAASSATHVAPPAKYQVDGGPPATPGDAGKALSVLGWSEDVAQETVPVLSVLDEFSRSCFAPHASLIEPRPDNWEGLLEKYQPRLLFVESSWKGNYGSWQYRVANYANPPGRELTEMVEGCRARGIPTVFWNKEDPVHFNNFVGAASSFDCVLTTAEEAVPRYQEKTSARIGVLQFAAEGSLHNPIGSSHRNGKVCFAGSFYANRFQERRDDQLMLLDAASAFDFDIFDRNHDPKATARSDFAFPERFSRFVRGRMPYSEMGKAYREYRVFLNVNSVIDSPTMFSRRVFELLACGTPIVSTWSRGTEETFGTDLVWHVRNREEAEEAIRVLMTDDAEWRRRSLAGIRAVFSQHTFKHRFRQVLEFAGCDRPQDELSTSVLVVARISTQAEADAVAASFSRQRLDQDVEARLVLLLDGSTSIHISTIKTTLVQNVGSSLGAYLDRTRQPGEHRLVAVMSPDSVYGAHHIQDLVHAIQYSGAMVVGRPNDSHQYQFGGTLDGRSLMVNEQFAEKVGGAARVLSEVAEKNWLQDRDTQIYAVDTSNFRPDCGVLSSEQQQNVLSGIEL